MTDKFKMAIPGVDVRHASPNELVVDSDQPNPKIYTLGSPPHLGNIFVNWQNTPGPIAQSTIVTLLSFPHNLGYIPITFATFQFNNGSTILNGILPFDYGTLGEIYIEADNTNINLKYISIDIFGDTIPPFTMQIKYYVMVEQGY